MTMYKEKDGWAAPAEIIQPTFDLFEYIHNRYIRNNLIVVEIGHGRNPIVARINDLTGQRAYVGVEAWLRDRSHQSRDVVADFSDWARKNNRNVSFIDQPLPGFAELSREDDFFVSSNTTYVGEYDPATILPNNAADEVYLSNVFGDPHIAKTEGATDKLLEEVARLIDPSGMIVVCENITPQLAGLNSERLERSGLKEVASFTPDMEYEWSLLSKIYDNYTTPLYGGFFKFIAKT
jgi:hypothetical protein